MNFTEFRIAYFRNFENEQVLQIASPYEDKVGSGITYIVGENNSGKTSLLEALQKCVTTGADYSKYVIGSDIKDQRKLHLSLFDESGVLNHDL